MESMERPARFAADLEALRAMALQSSILVVETAVDRADRAELHFQGRGLARGFSANAVPAWVDSHRVELRLPMSFPESPPDIRWLSPIFHPNVSYSGLVNLREINIEWTADRNLAVVAQRLWDVARCAFVNLDRASNPAARIWFQSQREFELPVDVRPLWDTASPPSSQPDRQNSSKEILFIGEDTPTPNIPVRIVSTPGRRFATGDDVLYIGDE